jgi:hypothetical protein
MLKNKDIIYKMFFTEMNKICFTEMSKIHFQLNHFFHIGLPYTKFIFDEYIFDNCIGVSADDNEYTCIFRFIDVPYKQCLLVHYNYKNSPLLWLFNELEPVIFKLEYQPYSVNPKTGKKRYYVETNKIPFRWFMLLYECVLPKGTCQVKQIGFGDYKTRIEKISPEVWYNKIYRIMKYYVKRRAKLYIHSPEWHIKDLKWSEFSMKIMNSMSNYNTNSRQPYYMIESEDENDFKGFRVRNNLLNQWHRILSTVNDKRGVYEMYGEKWYISSIDMPIEEIGIIYSLLKHAGVKCVFNNL